MDDLIERLDDDATTNFEIVKISHSKIQQFRTQLKIEAIKQAKGKALYLTGAINEELGEAITINEPNEVSDYNFASNRTSNISLKEMKKADYAFDSNNNENPAIDFKNIKLK